MKTRYWRRRRTV